MSWLHGVGRSVRSNVGVRSCYEPVVFFKLKVDSFTVDKNNLQNKSFSFAVRIVNLCKILRYERKEYTLSNQLMRLGTSIGANICETQQAQSRADFLSKLNIALKEASETEYWLRLLEAADYLTKSEFESMYTDCDELVKILVSSVRTIKN